MEDDIISSIVEAQTLDHRNNRYELEKIIDTF